MTNLGFDGEKYRHASAHQQEWGARLIAELELRGTENILDLGCGDGVLTAQLASLVPQGHVTGIDSSQSMLNAARRHVRPNLAFELLDISEVAYEARFDLIFSNATLHWVRDHRNLLGRVFAALRRGGILRWSFAGDGNCPTFNRTVREVMAEGGYADDFLGFLWPWYKPSIEQYQVLMGEFPFQERKVWGEKADRFFPDSEAMIRWLDQPSLVPFLAFLPEAKREGFREEVVQRMIRATRQEDGRCFEKFQRIHVYARK